ncbi:MAG: hypothetical protein ABIG31_03385 [Candidatus Omnitrophota bacterium]
MKPKILYISLAIFISVILINILINIWVNRESAKFQPAAKKAEHQQARVEVPSAFMEQVPQPPPSSVNKPAITVIKPPSKEEPAPVLEEKINESQKPEETPMPSTPSSAVSDGDSGDIADESASGITKINKYPSEIENKEMNERGIIMW